DHQPTSTPCAGTNPQKRTGRTRIATCDHVTMSAAARQGPVLPRHACGGLRRRPAPAPALALALALALA
ncbi:hypothetical protein ACT3TS_18045, partial [Specibacter sp. AOP5-B1-6]|uniref:hypothetical protein n=1 Tax=Specibacter sp. AOP5-B1-6 TaxID=3457653 RepID=UPI00402B365F